VGKLRSFALSLSFGFVVSCGSADVYRPLEVEIYGVSARASAVSLKMFTLDKPAKCTMLDQDQIVDRDAYYAATWNRGTAAQRNWIIPEVLDEELTVAIYTTDEENRSIQYTCREITYTGIGERETSVLTITLNSRADL